MNGYDKPPLGVTPYYVRAADRIGELAQSIERNAHSNATVKIRAWAREIIEQCDLMDTLRRVESEEAGNR